MISPPALRALDIGVQIGAKALLDGVSLELPSGSMTVLLGPNGAGKTTLLRVLAGVLASSRGEVLLDNARLRARRRSGVARLCAYLPQQSGSAFELRVEDVVALGRYPHLGAWGALNSADYERIHWAMERVGVAALRERTLPTLSGGERQRVLLARALAQSAPILLLDEPATALDVGWQLQLLGLLAELHRDGYTILAALHDLRAAAECFPRAVLLNQGRLLAEGPTESVIAGSELAAAFSVQARRAETWCFDPIQVTPTP